MSTTVDLESVAEQAGRDLDGADAAQIVRWAADAFGARFAVASSMQDTVLLHLAQTVVPEVEVLFLDTGYHFDETLQTRDRVAARYPRLLVRNLTPRQTVAEQDADYGQALFGRDPDLCCALRKTHPLDDALDGYDAWATGLRRVESSTRANTPVVSWDPRREKVKVAPLAAWTDAQVSAYAMEHDLIANPLLAQGYPSIGCAPCTRRVAPGEDARAGRWSGLGKTECGIHT